MSLHISAIAIQGDARQALLEFFDACDYHSAQAPEEISSWALLGDAMQSPEDKAVCFHEGWTTVIDPELVLMLEDEQLVGLSREFGIVLTMVCEGVSSTYGFSCFTSGTKIRSLTVTDGEIVDQTGDPIAEEAGIDHSTMFEDDVLRILEKLGYSYAALESAASFIVHHLEFAGELPPESVEQAQPTRVQTTVPSPVTDAGGTKNPWWKFW